MPLINDLAMQRGAARNAVIKVFVFLLLFLAVDRTVDAVLNHGLQLYFKLNEDSRIVCVGHSRTVLGIDSDLLQEKLGMSVGKYAIQGANAQDRFAMIRHLFAARQNSPECVVFDVSAYTFSDLGLSSNSWRLFLPFMDDEQMSEYIANAIPTQKEFLIHKYVRSTRYNEALMALSVRGYLGYRANLKHNVVDTESVQRRIDAGRTLKMLFNEDSYGVFRKTMEYVTSHDAVVVLAYIPTLDILNDQDRDEHDRIIQIIEDYAAQNEQILFINYSRKYEHNHELFSDGIHMNANGQRIVSEDLANDLSQLFESLSK